MGERLHYSMLLLLLLPLTAICTAVDYDQIIAETHAAAAKNREQQLTEWLWEGGASVAPPQCPDGPNDICHARKCRHCGCAGHAHLCPPPRAPPPPPGSYAGCPNQVQCGAMPTAIATLFRNQNASSVGAANVWLEYNFGNTSSDWWKPLVNNSGTGWSGPPLENSYSTAMFTMFNSRSRWVTAGEVAPMSPRAESGMKAFFLAFVEACARHYPGEAKRDPLFLHDSENIDTVRHTGCYLGSATLARFPDVANHTLPDKTTVYETAIAWENFTWSWLKTKALHGFFDELGSSGYWSRTWPCVWDLHSLSDPDSRVKQRAKMFIDLAMLEAELASIHGVRAGQKSRDKKGSTCAVLKNNSRGEFNASETCAKMTGNNPNLAHHMYTALTPQLYGDDVNGPLARLYQAPIVTQQIGDYRMGNVSILIHKLGVAPDTHGVYTMRNRMEGQIEPNPQTCSKERCTQTFRPYPCACYGGGVAYHNLLPRPKQVHVVSRTPAWSLAGVEFSPNDAFIANSQQRGTGLVFANDDHSAVALPHLTGEKWGLIQDDLMFVQRCGSCNYGGPSLLQIFNATSVWQRGEWWFMSAADVDGKAMGWAAMRAAYGGTFFGNATGPSSPRITGNVNLNDVWSPLILIASGASNATAGEFVAQVENAPLTVSADRSHISFGWRGKQFEFSPGPSTWKGKWALPTIDGKPIDNDPPFLYQSPHMNAELDSEVVMTTYGSYKLKYDFGDDTITRVA